MKAAQPAIDDAPSLRRCWPRALSAAVVVSLDEDTDGGEGTEKSPQRARIGLCRRRQIRRSTAARPR